MAGGEDCAGGVVLGLKWYSRWGDVERGDVVAFGVAAVGGGCVAEVEEFGWRCGGDV